MHYQTANDNPLGGIKIVNIQDDSRIWNEFVTLLKKGSLTLDKIRPHKDFLREPLMDFLTVIKEKVPQEELGAEPEIHKIDGKVHYLIPLTIEGKKNEYCFTFLVEGDRWYFQHVESIIIRYDKILSLPTSTFPDLLEAQKVWLREEFCISERVRLFNFLSKEKGEDFAFDWFKDGAGYFLAAKALIPFIPEQKAFILFICWEQANLRGSKVTLQKLDDNEAILIMKPTYFEFYKSAGHLRQQISFEDYRRIFEIAWQDRAIHAGWKLQIKYEHEECVFVFKKN
ncbi:MAG: hypothetical protein QXI91_00330 [Candidatus Bathyarchaeia archaeon]